MLPQHLMSKWILPNINQRIYCTVFSPLDHSTPSTSDTSSSLTDTLSLSSSDSDLRDKGIPTGRSRSSIEGSPSAVKTPLSDTEKEVTFYEYCHLVLDNLHGIMLFNNDNYFCLFCVSRWSKMPCLGNLEERIFLRSIDQKTH